MAGIRARDRGEGREGRGIGGVVLQQPGALEGDDSDGQGENEQIAQGEPSPPQAAGLPVNGCDRGDPGDEGDLQHQIGEGRSRREDLRKSGDEAAVLPGGDEHGHGGEGVLLGHEAGEQRHHHPPVQPHQSALGFQQAARLGQVALLDVSRRQVGQDPNHQGDEKDNSAGPDHEVLDALPALQGDGSPGGHVV